VKNLANENVIFGAVPVFSSIICTVKCDIGNHSGQLFFYMAFAYCVNVYMVSVHTGSM